MFFQAFKRLTAALKTKASSRDYDRSGSTWTDSSTDRGSLKRIMVFGDSNTFRPVGSNTRWPLLLETKDSVHLNVFNESCDGRTTKYDIGECNGLSIIGSKLKSYAPLDYVIVMRGTNDVKSEYGPPSTAESVDGMRQILNLIDVQSGGAKPILLTPPPLGNVTSGDLAGSQSRLPPIAAKHRLLAMKRDIQLVDIHKIIDITTDLESDMIHLNAAGRQKVADSVWTNLQNLTPPPEVEGFSAIRSGPNFILTWSAVGSETFYFRVSNNGKIIGRTMNTSFEVVAPAIDDSFTVEAVDFSQNISTTSVTVTYNKSGDLTPRVSAPSISLS